MPKTDWSSRVGEVFYDRKLLVEYCGKYHPTSGGVKHLFIWQCLRCGRLIGPSQFQDIIRYEYAQCCRDSAKYGSTRWGYKSLKGDYMRSLHNSATKRGLEFNVTSEYLYQVFTDQEGLCSYTGFPLEMGTGNASVDRIDPSKGYIPGNVQWVYTKVNYMKWDSTEEEFLDLCSLITSRRKEK